MSVAKAYSVEIENVPSYIVWARTEDHAKTVALRHYNSYYCDDIEMDEISVVRKKELDGQRPSEYVNCSEDYDDQVMLRNAGWFCSEHSELPCYECGLYEWPEVPESKLDYTDRCGACGDKGKS